jgi:hypothetical protein
MNFVSGKLSIIVWSMLFESSTLPFAATPLQMTALSLAHCMLQGKCCMTWHLFGPTAAHTMKRHQSCNLSAMLLKRTSSNAGRLPAFPQVISACLESLSGLVAKSHHQAAAQESETFHCKLLDVCTGCETCTQFNA